MSSLQVTPPLRGVAAGEHSYSALSPGLDAELLDPEGWRKILEQYARTMRVAVALTDLKGQLLGTCHNPQAIWRQVREVKPAAPGECSFCLDPTLPCTAVTEALQTGRVVMARDETGLAHVAVPLSLGDRQLGALIAGQVFDRYPEPLPLQRLARKFDVSAQQLWREALLQAPVSRATLRVYGDLLASLGQAFLRERYAAILDRKLAETNQRYRLMIDGVKDYGLYTVDTNGCVTSWNKGAERLLGYTEAEILGRPFTCFFIPQDVQSGAPGTLLESAARGGSIEEEG
ncbi:MAG: PocR ligand-binding domain-containing protein, partial [Acidobacteriota bacterium]|nr:PocR ligand-binding domain-containing protein [Acidobacteriota bacterium]